MAASAAAGRARIGVLVVFFGSGLGFATWASRLVMVRETLGITPAQMGGILLLSSVGSILAMPTAGTLILRFGIRWVVGLWGTVTMVGLMGAGLGTVLGAPWCVGVSLVVFGAGMGLWDVGINVAGTDTERALHRAVMPHFHAAFSLGTVAAAGFGAAMSGLGVPLMAHFGAVAAIVVGALAWGTNRILTGVHATSKGERERSGAGAGWRAALRAWGERRTLLIGLVVLSMALAEGAANDWLASGLVEGFAVKESLGIVGLAVFLVAMTAVRTVGPRVIERWGRVRTLRLSALMAAVGLTLYGLSPWLIVALVGAACWGAGSALGFPLGMSAAGDDPLHAAQRTSVVATIAYGAFLAGPPVLGMIADAIGFRHALLYILIPVAIATILAPVLSARGESRR
ncbi:MAG: MFS transporter [Bifidobacteriaceae bacterium]|nr:MFS transporter [Bifidobacteriaceae bacterium]